jgi:hypothetical protein
LEERVARRQKDSTQSTRVGDVTTILNWQEIARSQSPNSPFLAVWQGHALAIVRLDNIPRSEAYQMRNAVEQGHILLWPVFAMCPTFPILGPRFVIFDSPSDPFTVEDPRDIRLADIQDFITSVLDQGEGKFHLYWGKNAEPVASGMFSLCMDPSKAKLPYKPTDADKKALWDFLNKAANHLRNIPEGQLDFDVAVKYYFGKTSAKPPQNELKRYDLVVEGPEWGYVDESQLQAVLNKIQVPIVDGYGEYIEDVYPFLSTDVGKITLKLKTCEITQQQAQKISQFIRTLLEQNKPLGGKMEKETVQVPNTWGVGDGKPFVVPRNPNVSELFANSTPAERNILPYAYLNHPDAKVRLATIAELRKLGGYHLSNQCLVDRLADSSSDVRRSAANALWANDEALENALQCLRDEIHRSGFSSTMSPQEALAGLDVLRDVAPSTKTVQFEESVANIIGNKYSKPQIKKDVNNAVDLKTGSDQISIKAPVGTQGEKKMSSEETIAQFLQQLGAPATPFNNLSGTTGIRGTVATYMSLQVDIQVLQGNMLLAQFVIGYLPKTNAELILRQLMVLNSTMIGVYFCVFNANNAIVLRTSRVIEGLDYVEFKQALDTLCLAFIQNARSVVQTFQIPQQPT